MKKTHKRILSLALSLSMVLGITLTSALAEELPAMPGGDMAMGDMGGMPGGDMGMGMGGGASGSTVYVHRITSSSEDNLSSFAAGGWTAEDDDYAYVSALYVNGGVIDDRSVTEAITAGTYTATEADGIVIKSTYEGFNPVIIHDSVYTIKNADITIDSEGDGLVTNDFSGYGAAIATYGDDTILTIENSKVNVSGVANLTVFTDDGSDVIIRNSQMHSDGGTLHADYKNSPDQTTMVAPPWILGIMGTSRCTNLMGTNSSMTVIESDMTAAQWAILSTDSGSNMTLTVIDSYMGLTGADYDLQADGRFQTEWGIIGSTANPYTDKAGYGTYTIGKSNQKFYGVDMEVGTYANIYTGGIGLYTAMKAGETITALDANGVEVTTYTPAEDKVTTINSDTFGFMIHQGSNTLTIEEGTVVNSGYTSLLLKTGCTMDALISSGAVLNPGNGILLQVMDNDDATTGMDVSTFSFYTTHEEYEGWPTVGTTSANSASTFTFEDVTLVGDIFNGSGWELNSTGAQTASPIVITLAGDTTLKGQVSSTAAIHVTKEGSDAIAAAAAGEKASEAWVKYQNTSFPIGHYFDIGQVANMVASNGFNTVDVVLEDNAVWTVTADGIVNNVTAASKAIVADKAVTLTVEGTLTLDGEVVTETTTVGNVTYKIATVEVEDKGIDVSGWVVGDSKTGYPDISGATTVPGTDLSVKIVDGNGDGEASEGDAVLQYEASTMLGWLDATGALTTTYPLAAEGGMPGGDMGMGDMGGMPGGDMGGMPGGDMGGMPGGDMGGGMGGGASASVAPEGMFAVTLDADGVVTGVELVEIATKGSFSSVAAAPRTALALNEHVSGQELVDPVSFHNGVIYDAAGKWVISNSTITMLSDADGSDTNDFSGLGAAVMANGENVITKIANSKIEVSGVAKLALFTDNGAISIVDDSEMYAYGGVIYDGYMSTADQSVMVSPPWVLGLGGNAEDPCNARTTNLMGDYSVAAYIDSYFYAKGWGALSVDSGTNMNMVVMNTDVDVETSGYGAYNIGNSTETYYGSSMDVSTYAIIMTGGEATFRSLSQGQWVKVVQFDGETNEYGHGINGNVISWVTSDKVEGTRFSSIVSDNFGFMCHNNGSSGWNVVNILDGTSVTTKDAVFLVKKVSAVINVEYSYLESTEKNVILQIIDNDDDYVGLDFTATWGEDNEFGHAYGSHMPTFNSVFHEDAGYSNEWIADTAAAKSGDTTNNWVVEYNMVGSNVEGDLWNSTGYVGSNPATTLNVTLGKDSKLAGAISAGAFSHDVKDATVGNGDWTAADALGHVTNIPCSNGVNLVNVTLTDNGVWAVAGDSIIDTLTITGTAQVVVRTGATLTVGGVVYPAGTVLTAGSY